VEFPGWSSRRSLNHVETGLTAVYERHSYDPEKPAGYVFDVVRQ